MPLQFLKTAYVSAVEAAGGLPLILPVTQDPATLEALADRVQGLLISGSGPDLDPSLYGETQDFSFRTMNPARACFEAAFLRLALERGLAVLGICGGMQILNVVLGGTLFQDIGGQIPGALAHRSEGGGRLLHEVRAEPGTRLGRMLGEGPVRVNSSHHQAVKSLGEGLRISAKAPDGVIEGIEHRGQRFTLGVQWHPEVLYAEEKSGRLVFQAFLDAARDL